MPIDDAKENLSKFDMHFESLLEGRAEGMYGVVVENCAVYKEPKMSKDAVIDHIQFKEPVHVRRFFGDQKEWAQISYGKYVRSEDLKSYHLRSFKNIKSKLPVIKYRKKIKSV